jgi:hypothetical protein
MRSFLFPFVTLAALAGAQGVAASGEIGEHVNDLEAHIDEYTEEVKWLLDKADGIVEAYAADGAEAAQADQLTEHWEAVKFHGAIETTYVPVYANIWQGIYGIQQAIDDGKPQAAVREQQAIFERALWQALGAVKLAAQQQQQAGAPAAARHEGHDEAGPAATLEQIGRTLDEIVATYANEGAGKAKSMVHATYMNRFEGVEGVLIEQDAALVEALEKDFNVTLPMALDEEAPVKQVKEIVQAMQTKLEKAASLVADAEQQKKDVF